MEQNLSPGERGKNSQCMVGVLGAEQQEVNLLREKLVGAEVFSIIGVDFWSGTLADIPVVIACSGIGKVNAALCVQVMVDHFNVARVINTGTAGATEPEIDVFDMIACTDTASHDLDLTKFGFDPGQLPGMETAFFYADEKMRHTAMKVFSDFNLSFYSNLEEEAARAPSQDSAGNPINRGFFSLLPRLPIMKEGRIVSGDAFICEESVRSNIIERFSPSCVEMEGSAVGQASTANGIPFLILRSITDMAGKGASLSYENFSELASRISASVVVGMMELSAEWL